MTKTEWLKLQNGSDIRGVACAGAGGESVNLTEEAARRIGRAFALELAGRLGREPSACRIALGRDCRITGATLLESMAGGILQTGAAVLDCGLASTPAMFMSTVYPETACDGACMVTASHLPYYRNGFKFFDADGGYDKTRIRALLEAAADEETAGDGAAVCTADKSAPGAMRQFPLIELYAQRLCDYIRKEAGAADYAHPLAALHIVVDAGNGSGGFFADRVLEPLGADTTGSQFLDPDGTFPNHIPNPEDKQAMAAVCGAVKEHRADLGLIFDTDVDRMSAVLPDGTALHRDAIIAMFAAILSPDYPGSTIVTDSVTSDRLTVFLEEHLGLKHYRYRRGYKNVIDKCRELNAQGITSPLAMETSGHGCLKENYYLDDGAFLAVKLLIAVAKAAAEGQKIADLIRDFSTEFADREVRFRILEEDFAAYADAVLAEYERRAKESGYTVLPSHEGIRLKFAGAGQPEGWALLRASLHDPVMVLNMEGRTEEDCARIAEKVRVLTDGFDKLDTGALQADRTEG